jgi:hypothetical protein
MPYSDPDVQREYNRQLFAVRYHTDPEFREAEAYRKAKWYQKNRERVIAHVRKARKKLRRKKNSSQLETASALTLFASML